MTDILFVQVVITNLEGGSSMGLDAKKWPDAHEDDVTSFYKVTTGFFDKNYHSIFLVT